MSLFDELIFDIEKEYEDNLNDLGWRFLMNSKSTLTENNGIALITLNPGGKEIPKDHGWGSCENGCSYLVESWADVPAGESPLQVQFRGLFQMISSKIGNDDYVDVMENSLLAHFIPFRSPDYKSLLEKKRCIKFSIGLWKKILNKVFDFKYMFFIDEIAFKHITDILKDFGLVVFREKKMKIGWGDYSAKLIFMKRDSSVIKLAKFPHLSRFKIFNRPASEHYLNEIFDEIFNV